MNLPALKPRLRFSIRAILVLMTLFALFCWYHINWIQQRRELTESGVVTIHRRGGEVTAPKLLGLFGESGHSRLVVKMPLNDPDISRIQALFPEAVLDGYLPVP